VADMGSPAGQPAGEWLAVRRVLKQRRPELARAAAALYPRTARVAGTDLLCRPQWLPARPLELSEVALAWTAEPAPPAVTGMDGAAAHVLPAGDGRSYTSYAEAIAGLDPPKLLDNRVCYRLLDAALAGAAPGLRLGPARYFDGVSIGHALGHELAAAWRDSPAAPRPGRLPLRAAVGDPCDLGRRCAIPAITTLTLRRGAPGEASFLLHWRDPAKVNHAGGVYQVVPVGVFQPVSDTPAAAASDLSLWRGMAREFSEELLGGSEEYQTSGGVLDYGAWPFYRRLSEARRAGEVTVHCLGAGVDPLTLATDILTVAVFGADVFDAVFGELVAVNAEGRMVTEAGSALIPFTSGTVARFAGGGEPVQASGAAVLQLAWRHRGLLLR
jgi:hypothetical protein